MLSYTIHPICRNCYESYLRQGGGIDRNHNGVCRRRIFMGGVALHVDAREIPCSVCENPFTGDPWPDYDQMGLYLMTEDEIGAYFVDVTGVAVEA